MGNLFGINPSYRTSQLKVGKSRSYSRSYNAVILEKGTKMARPKGGPNFRTNKECPRTHENESVM